MKVTIKAYNELSTDEFHDVIQLRIAVFVIEQNCPYQDVDGKDKHSFHVLVHDEQTGILIGTARILPAGVSYAEVSIGRVASHPGHRKHKVGHALMHACMEFITLTMRETSVRISAQSYLCRFYAQYGFVSTGKEYLEDNIPHTEMLYLAHH